MHVHVRVHRWKSMVSSSMIHFQPFFTRNQFSFSLKTRVYVEPTIGRFVKIFNRKDWSREINFSRKNSFQKERLYVSFSSNCIKLYINQLQKKKKKEKTIRLISLKINWNYRSLDNNNAAFLQERKRGKHLPPPSLSLLQTSCHIYKARAPLPFDLRWRPVPLLPVRRPISRS